MTDNEIIDKILEQLFKSDSTPTSIAHFICKTFDIEEKKYAPFVDRLEAEGLANSHNVRYLMTITDFGRQVCKKGGWLVHLDNSVKERQRQLDREQLEIDLTKSNIEANKLNQINARQNKRATIVNIVIGIINLLVAFVSIIIAYLVYKAGQ